MARPYGMQRLRAGAKWAADALRDELVAYVVEQVGAPRAALIIDEPGFLKHSTHAVGVKPSGRTAAPPASRIKNCPIGGFLTSASPAGHVLLDRELSLPQDWAQDRARQVCGRCAAGARQVRGRCA